MSKKLLAIIALVMCLLFAFAACDSKKDPLSADNSAVVTESNGGFLAETADYVYFINGSELYTEDNTEGKVEKGALVRLSKADLAAGKAAKEVVVSKILSTSDYSAGISIYDGRIYFATPSAEKDKVGTIQNSDVKFCSAKLDGTDVKEFATAKGSAGNGVAYRFVKNGDNVYVLFLSSETEDDVTTNYINVVSADGTAKAKEAYATYVFDKGADAKYVYFTKSIENETLDITESFNEVYRLEIGAASAEKILYGAGSNRNVKDAQGNLVTEYKNKDVQGVTYTLIAAQNGYLYLSVVNVDTSISTNTFYAYLAENVGTDTEANHLALSTANLMTRNGSTSVFAATSIYNAPTSIVYIDSAKGLCSYDYTAGNSYVDFYGVTAVYTSETVKTATLNYVKGGYIYYNVGGVYYRVAYSYDTALTVGSEEEKLSPVGFSTTWYAPETVAVGNDEYIIGSLSGADYYNYIFAYKVLDEADLEKKATEHGVNAYLESVVPDEDDLDDAKEAVKELTYAEFLTGTAGYNAKYTWDKFNVSLVGEDAQSEITKYLASTYPVLGIEVEEEEDDGCGSVAGVCSVLGIAMLAAGAVALKKRG